jgi:phage-related protein
LTIRGSGEIELSVNGVALFDISLGSEGYITIDAQTMNAYKGDDLKNRLVSGDYSKLLLPIGASVISWTGTVNEIDVENVSRWI